MSREDPGGGGLRGRLAATSRQRGHGPFRRFLADVTRPYRSIRALRRSGLFDESWYIEQLPAGERPRDPVAHYVRRGATLGLSPHPLFDPGFYLEHRSLVNDSAAVPFLEFLTRGCHRGDDPHPLFSVEGYLEQVPKAGAHRHGAFGHFFESTDSPWPSRDLHGLADDPTGAGDWLELVARATQVHGAVEDHTGFARSFHEFDHASAERFIRDMRAVVASMDRRPLVTVVLPTKDRQDIVTAAIRSIQQQTWTHWELVVVDDGGVDGTPDVVAELAGNDPRIHYIHQQNTGVAGARNRGIRESSGELIAYLDSDNTWEPEFLQTMVGFLHEGGLRAAYAASELRGEDQVEYRGQPLHAAALRERNYIDCITLVHERSLVEDLGGRVFDERLRRVVDWDLLIRLSEITELGYAPFIATRYDLWDETIERITTTENPGYRQVVRDKHMVRWSDAPEPVAGRTTVIVTARGPGDREVDAAMTTVRELVSASTDLEIHLVDNGLDPRHAVRLRALEQGVQAVTVTRIADPASVVLARNVAAAQATGDVLVLLEPGVRVKPAAIVSLARAIRSEGAMLAAPTIIGTDGRVHSTGQLLGPRASQVSVGSGMPLDDPALTPMIERDGVDGVAFAIDARTFRTLKGMEPLFVRGAADLDLGLRARLELGVPTRSVRASLMELPSREAADAWSPSMVDRDEFARRWRDHPARDLTCLDSDAATLDGLEPMPQESPGLPRRWRAQLRPRRSRRRWAIKTSVPDAEVRQSWGDWHFACALRDALAELGEDAVVDCRPAWYRPGSEHDDVNLVLRGTQRFEARPDKLNLIWVISHPELLSRPELEQFDQVFVASMTYPDELSRRWPGVSATPLLQCTDPRRFRPEPDPALQEDLLFVGNSRNVLRTVVSDALQAGLEPAVYGSRWEELIPPPLVKGTYLPNEALRRHYASASIVLNDHWEDMRQHGFVSNRLFDAVASGARVVTDSVPGLDGIFGDRVVSYDAGPDELLAAIDEARSRPMANPEMVASIAEEHNFLARARTLVEAADRLAGSAPGPSRAATQAVPSNGRRPRPRRPAVTAPSASGSPAQAGTLTAVALETAPAARAPLTISLDVPPVFVGGTGRSGTTIVGQLVAASRRYTAVPVEIRLHTDRRGLVDLVAGRIDVEEFADNVWERWYLRSPNNSGPRGLHVIASRTQVERALDQLREGVEIDAAKAAGQFLRDLLDPLAEAEGTASWVETTPPSVRAAGVLARAMPDARFVHMARDGRDVATSVIKRGWGPNTMSEALDWWADELIDIARSTAHLSDRQVLHLRLESLVGPDRQEAYRRLAGFLDLEKDPDARAFFEENLSSNRAHGGRWERGLAPREAAEIQRKYDAVLERLAAEGVELPAA